MRTTGRLLRSVLLSTGFAFASANAATITGGAPTWHYTTLTATGTYIPVTAQVLISGVAQGGCGGGGQASASTSGGGAGGSGSYVINYPVSTIPGSAITATFGSTCSVGAAGSNGGLGYDIVLTGTQNTLMPRLYGGGGGNAGAAGVGGTGGASGMARVLGATFGAAGGTTGGGGGATSAVFYSSLHGSGAGGGAGAATAGAAGASGSWFQQIFAVGGGTDGGGGGGPNIFGNGGVGGANGSVGLAPTIGNGGGGGGGGTNAAGGLPGPGFVQFAELY